MTAGLVCASVAVVLFAYGWVLDYGYRRGMREGYEEGKADGIIEGKRLEENWWIGAEDDVDRKRMELWRADGQTSEERWP